VRGAADERIQILLSDLEDHGDSAEDARFDVSEEVAHHAAVEVLSE
jgi:hypothetical protein